MSNNKYKILIVEDDSSICGFLETVLTTAGYQVLQAHTCSQGVMMFASHVPDLVVLDLGLPDMDGDMFLKEVRKTSNTPVIVLSARSDESDKVSALDLGANDYMTKPFGTAELQARVRAALRINRGLELPGDNADGKYVMEDLEIDYARRMVTVAGKPVHLTQTEYNILAFLSRHTGQVMTYASIIRHIWGDMADNGSVKKLQVNMANIRKKLGVRPGENRYIVNELGVGYRMCDENL